MSQQIFYVADNNGKPVPATFLVNTKGNFVTDAAYGQTFTDSQGGVNTLGSGSSYKLYTDPFMTVEFANPNNYLVVPTNDGTAAQCVSNIEVERTLSNAEDLMARRVAA